MINLNYSVKLSGLLALGTLSVGSLSAQFLEANAQEAQAYAGVIDQGATAISAASDFSILTLASGAGFSGGYNYDSYEADSPGSDRSFDSDIEQNSLQLAYVHDFGGIIAGLGFTYLDTEMESDFSDTGNVGQVDADGDGWIFSLGAAHSWDALTVLATGGYGSLSQDGERSSQSAFVGTSPSDLETDLLFVTIEVNYEVELSETFDLLPFAQLNYQDVETDGFSEEAGAADTGALDSFDRDSLIGEVGVRSEFELSEDLSLLASLSWIHDFNNDEVELSGDFQVGASPGSVDVESVGQDRIQAALGIAYRINEQWALSAGLDFSTGDEVDTFGGGLVVNRSF